MKQKHVEVPTICFQQVYNGPHFVFPALHFYGHGCMTDINDRTAEYLHQVTKLTTLGGAAPDL